MELNHLPIIDWTLALKLANHQQDLAEEFLALFIKRLPEDMHTLNQLFTQKNYTELKYQLHKLQGALAYSGLPRLKTLVEHLERNIKNNVMLSLPPLLDQLGTEVNRLLEHFTLKQSEIVS